VKHASFVLATLAVLLTAGAVFAAAPARQTRQRAERNLLGATRMVARWHMGLVDPKSGLLRLNTSAACSGRGRAVMRQYTHFVCILRHQGTVVRALYIAQSRNGFEVRRLKTR
jgi:hypothetical protein